VSVSDPAAGQRGADLADPSVVGRILRSAGIRPSRRLGQNFLVSRRVVERIVDAAGDAHPDLIVEIGAGLGTVTRTLAQVAPRVVAVEVDRRLAGLLEENVADLKGVAVVRDDILKLELAPLAAGGTLWVVGSIPYRISSEILLWLVRQRYHAQGAILLTQQEVASKVQASPGPGGTALGVYVRAYAEAESLAEVPRGCFRPVPEVDSLLWRLTWRERPAFAADEDSFFQLVRTLYGVRRKMLRRALRLILPEEAVGLVLEAAGIDGRVRGETLGFAELDRLAGAVQQERNGGASAGGSGEPPTGG